MGCSANHMDQLVYYEEQMLGLSRIDPSAIQKQFVSFPYRGSDIFLRTITIDTKDESKSQQKPTLVLIHGFASSSVLMYPIFHKLSSRYRLVLLDQLGWGASTRIDQLPADVIDKESADTYALGWLEEWFLRVQDLPEKVYLCGHSYGGYLSLMYAQKHPERIDKLFLNSPVGTQPYEVGRDPLSVRYTAHTTGTTQAEYN